MSVVASLSWQSAAEAAQSTKNKIVVIRIYAACVVREVGSGATQQEICVLQMWHVNKRHVNEREEVGNAAETK